MIRLNKAIIGLGATVALAGCTMPLDEFKDIMPSRAEMMTISSTGWNVETLPPPSAPLDVSVYSFPDLTGQNEPNENYAEFSRAVTQGGSDLLIDVLSKAGDGQWFNVVERSRVESLLRERSIIEQTQQNYVGGSNLPPLRFSGTLIEGSIVGYDTNTLTGGIGARYLGIGIFNEYRQDVVTVALRAVSVSTGRVLTSTTTTKTIYSVLVQGGAFRFVQVDELLEAEAGYSRNEPELFAVREAMELAVLSMIVEGAVEGHWSFADQARGQQVIDDYIRRYELSRQGYAPHQIKQILGDEQG